MTSAAKPATSNTTITLSTDQSKDLRKILKRFTRQTNRRPQKTKVRDQIQLNLHPLDQVEWPDVEAIAAAQNIITEENRPVNLQLDAQGLYRDADRVWIPQDATALLTRILIVAHNGSMGHRGHDSPLGLLQIG